jgi:hypothetical protein
MARDGLRVLAGLPPRRDETVTSMERVALTGLVRIRVGSRELVATPVLSSYWTLATERQRVYYGRLSGRPGPWTDDPVVQRYRFTNAYRAADRVSQDLLRVQYHGPPTATEIVFRTLLFRLFNRTNTWQLLERSFGTPTWSEFELARYATILSRAMAHGQRIYSAAYILPPPRLGAVAKHENHLRLVELMMSDRLPERVTAANSLRQVYELIRSYPSMGPFLAYQLAIDLNYSTVLSFDEDDFVVAGPGARSGIAKCFADTGGLTDEEIIRWMADSQEKQCAELGLDFRDLFGRRLRLIDCQNLFCETDKYARVAHPEIVGRGDRTRIKQEFAPAGPLSAPFFPPKWGLDEEIGRRTGDRPDHLPSPATVLPNPSAQAAR